MNLSSSPAFHPLSLIRSFGNVIRYCPLCSTIFMWESLLSLRAVAVVSTEKDIEKASLYAYWILKI